jgi:acetate kinase
MGFTPTGGFMMSTRSGDLDPGLMVYLINQKDYDGRRLQRLVNHESGLLGVSAISSDVKRLLERRAAEPNAALAIEMFCYQMRKQIGALAAALGGWIYWFSPLVLESGPRRSGSRCAGALSTWGSNSIGSATTRTRTRSVRRAVDAQCA